MRLILAPMEGLTDPIMRDVLTRIGHYDWCVSEFIRVTDSLLPDHIYHAYCPELLTGGCTAAGSPLHVQFLGNDADMIAANAVRVVELGAPAIDLNFGCPAKTVNRHRGGAVLLDETETLYNIVSTVRQAVPAHIPVSAKMRLGYLDDSPALQNALAIEAAGASWLTIHARTKADGYTPPAYWGKIAPLRRQLSIPIIANGEIWSSADADACQQQSACTDLMLGRGAVTRPDLVNQIRFGAAYSPLTWSQAVYWQLDFLAAPAKTDVALIGRYKQWLGMLSKGYPEAAVLWQQAKRLTDLSTLRQLLHNQLTSHDHPC